MKRNPTTGTTNFYPMARDWLHTYLPVVRHASVKTIEAYRISLESFIGFLSDHHGTVRDQVTFDHFDREHIKAWIGWMNDTKRYAARTVTLRFSAIKAFLAYTAAEDITLVALHQAAATTTTPSAHKTPIEYLDARQTTAILAANTGKTTKSRRNRMLLILLYETAARISEITTITLGSIHATAPGHVTLKGKRNKTRIVPLSDATLTHLKIYLDEFHPGSSNLPADRPLFHSTHHGQPARLSTDTVAAILKAAANTARASKPSIPPRIHCHMLRKTKAIDLYQQGIPLPIIMRLLGHQSTTTTSTFYAFTTLDMMRAAINTATPTPQPHTNLTQETITTLTSLR